MNYRVKAESPRVPCAGTRIRELVHKLIYADHPPERERDPKGTGMGKTAKSKRGGKCQGYPICQMLSVLVGPTANDIAAAVE